METLAIVFAILTVAFVLDLARERPAGYYDTELDLTPWFAKIGAIAAVTFGVLAAV